jgi:hypothetical protein
MSILSDLEDDAGIAPIFMERTTGSLSCSKVIPSKTELACKNGFSHAYSPLKPFLQGMINSW